MATAPTHSVATTSGQPQQSPKLCPLCTPIGRQCPNNYILLIHPECSDPEEEKKDLNKQEKEEEQDWDGTIQKQK